MNCFQIRIFRDSCRDVFLILLDASLNEVFYMLMYKEYVNRIIFDFKILYSLKMLLYSVLVLCHCKTLVQSFYLAKTCSVN